MRTATLAVVVGLAGCLSEIDAVGGSEVVAANQVIVKPALHVNDMHEGKMVNGTFDPATRRCSNPGCHGVETW
jgi:hypothetical protein